MWKKFSPPRTAQTTIPCASCGQPLVAMRTCHTAYLRCEKCTEETPVQAHIHQMDTALENFLEAINCDRI